MEAVFRALGAPARQRLLDALFARDGQTLGSLVAQLEMTRFGVMKHLRVLEDAGLVVTRQAGREKLHYLNPVPIRDLHDRWISKYAEPCVSALTTLRTELEQPMANSTETKTRTHVFPDLHPLHAGAALGRDHVWRAHEALLQRHDDRIDVGARPAGGLPQRRRLACRRGRGDRLRPPSQPLVLVTRALRPGGRRGDAIGGGMGDRGDGRELPSNAHP